MGGDDLRRRVLTGAVRRPPRARGAVGGRVASSVGMTNADSSRYPVTVTQLPVVRCQICRRTVAHRPGNAGAVLTEHYRRVHVDALAARTD